METKGRSVERRKTKEKAERKEGKRIEKEEGEGKAKKKTKPRYGERV